MKRGGRVEALCELFPFRLDGSQSLLAAGLDLAAESQATCPTKPRVGSRPLQLSNRSDRDGVVRGHCRRYRLRVALGNTDSLMNWE